MSWGKDLWDQYPLVCSQTEQGIEFVKRVATFVEKRIHVEESYAKELRKLVKQFKRKDEDESKYSAVKAFSSLVMETNDYAGQRELIAEYLQTEVLEQLKQLAKDVTLRRKKHLLEGEKALRELQISKETLEKVKKQYERASEEADNASHALEKADNDPNSTKARIDRLTQTMRAKDSQAEECRNNYILQLETTNDKQRLHYDSEMPQVFQQLEEMNAARCARFSELVSAYAECQRKVFPIINTCLDNITATAEVVDPSKDNLQLIEDHKTGYPVPADYHFQEYHGKNNKKGKGRKAKYVEPKEDFSHLPPAQRIKKLQGKVSDLEAAIGKAESDKIAMQKMVNIYSQNPQLGDAKQVSQSLEQNEGKLEELFGNLKKFKDWLVEAENPATNTSAAATMDKNSSKSSLTPAAPSGVGPPPKAIKNQKQKEKAHQHPSPPPKQQDEWSSDDDDDDDEEDEDEKRGGGGGGGIKRGQMIYDFDAQNEDEMSARANDLIEVLEDLEDGWLKVKKGKDEGYVPKSYVNIGQS